MERDGEWNWFATEIGGIILPTTRSLRKFHLQLRLLPVLEVFQMKSLEYLLLFSEASFNLLPRFQTAVQSSSSSKKPLSDLPSAISTQYPMATDGDFYSSFRVPCCCAHFQFCDSFTRKVIAVNKSQLIRFFIRLLFPLFIPIRISSESEGIFLFKLPYFLINNPFSVFWDIKGKSVTSTRFPDIMKTCFYRLTFSTFRLICSYFQWESIYLIYFSYIALCWSS